ncbi:hypothetical protein FisN_10Lh042 [Fistulifera solaris]|uniref:Uncharacterized protein n=1 Tax=Fistulifera solaris TaxID=1519565 RepID=A0A1Z5JT26_FISSO|nr:hypothetical protein FisN_10Lh042 [Fistulifera solaris]|eukprot:GAX17193.1 hypothetical protein FisN_10Lh042 [Fistulifera solaris]
MIATAAQSEYEIARAQNIERNNARLRALGLITEDEERQSNAAGWGKQSKPLEQVNHSQSASTSNEKQTKKRPSPSAVPESRKSRRLLGLPTEQLTSNATNAELQNLPVIPLEQRHQARQEAALRYYHSSDDAAQKAAAENPTATYEHCWMRIQSMTHAGLAKRIKVMERAAGKHCVVKMAIFAKCLQDEGLSELAADAKEALERLKALQPPPES